MEGRSVLLVSYHFPPMGGSGVQRALKLAKYLPSYGLKVRVLCAGHTHYPLIDETLCDELDPSTIVDRVTGWEPGGLAARLAKMASPFVRTAHRLKAMEDRVYWRLASAASVLDLPEPEQLWKPAALKQACRVVKRDGIAAVITTSPPVTTHLIGQALKRKFGVPWIADLRDPITDNFAYAPKDDREDAFFRRVERLAVEESDACVVTCPELAVRLCERFGSVDPNRVHVITNGCDEEDAPAEEPPSEPAVQRRGDRFEMLYVGAFYRQQTIKPMLEALRLLLDRRPDLRGMLRFRIVGSLSATERELLRTSDGEFLAIDGYMPHADALRAMRQADMVVLMTPGNEGGRLCIPAKVYEYLAFGPHILAIIHQETELERWLADAGNVTLVRHPVRVEALADTIRACFDRYRGEKLQDRRDGRVARAFTRRRIAGRYASLLRDVVCPNWRSHPRLLETEAAPV